MADLNMIKPLGVQGIINKFCCTIGMLPTSYKQSLTYEEQIFAIGHYLESVVYPAINNNAEALTELQGLFIELKNYVDNYFEDLDVQEEINNKLDDMAESGDLQEIIAAYLDTKAVIGYDTISNMVNAENIENTTYARTMGANSLNDKGGALYKIRNITGSDVVDGFNKIEINNEKIAERIKNEEKINCFDTLAEIKACSNLKNGMYARSLGYYSKNDGGGALYKIRTVTNDDVVDEATIVEMTDDTLIAELIIENSIVNAKVFGCKGDGTTDDTTNLQKAFTYAKTNKLETFIPTGNYKTTATLEIQGQIVRGEGEHNTKILPTGCDGILIKYDDSGTNKGISDLSINGNDLQIEFAGVIFEQRTNSTRNHNVFLQNLGFNNWGCAIYMQDCHRCTVQNIGIWNCFIGINIQRKTVQCSFINVCDNYNLAEDLTSTRFGNDNIGALVGDHTQANQKPEGIKFTQCCFTNHNIGLWLDFCLYFNAYQCEFDICRKKCIYFRNVDGGCVVNGCWLNVRGANVTNAVEIQTVQTTDENTIEILNNIITATDIGEENTCSAIKNLGYYLTATKVIGNEIKCGNIIANQFDHGIYFDRVRKAMIQDNTVYNCKSYDIRLGNDQKNNLIGNSGKKIKVTVFQNTTLYSYANMFSTVEKTIAGTLIGELAE